jgi:hypothetical protein
MKVTFEELSRLPTDEAETVILANLPSDLRLVLKVEDFQWVASLIDENDVCVWWGESPDKRILLYDVYGQVMIRSGVKSRHPAWVRKSDQVRIPAKFGQLAHQTNIQIDEPEDLDPGEIGKLYGLKPNKDSIR